LNDASPARWPCDPSSFHEIEWVKRLFWENRFGQTASGSLGRVDLEKKRELKKKNASNGRPRQKLWPFEVSQIYNYFFFNQS